VPVSLNNDVEAAVIAECHDGAGQGHPYVLYVTISTGIGASLAINGEVYHGAHNLEAGHMVIDPNGPVCSCGGKGHFEAIASGKAIRERYGQYGYEITDPATWNEIAATLAPGFYNYVRCYSPSIILVGGGIGAHHAKFHRFLVEHLEKLPLNVPLPPIAQAKHTETAVAYGAIIAARRLK
jgi:glucokinase